MPYDERIENTFAEAFTGKCVRAIITAEDEEIVKKAAFDATSTPGAVIGRVEGGVERFLDASQTPDNRPGAIVQFYFGLDDLEKFEVELSYRIRQDILVKPFTSLYNATPHPEGYLGMMKQVGHCGDGYEWEENIYGREMIVVPIALPDFKIEKQLGYQSAVMGANFWYMCRTKKGVMEAGNKALEAIREIEGVITPFDICSAASKVETNYPWIGPTTNHPYCPSLKPRLKEESLVPDDVNYVPEIVINGLDMDKVEMAMKAGLKAVLEVDDVLRVSAGNYQGKLGDYQINLRDLF
ncbi:formylmethanofuran--tetrahydromethanopterin N-formyltransferase [Methanobacterium alkalithermotolerans]|uniref:Formylmethanofuran--tetrahydromethanopterin N-formyltransferase n=1 Tax=Methanobacterium alkalithermotolerans TaxID=2731220 RepID=A0A8T8K3H5_9EURY|nr:formylmethanofuran--tetrahydromethanopterin N-formyltransferase [Methanobacterium alkalithermotolerans]QUH22537.1 formylmethanofuran--tetrahydromethanopterin N-formyltransferase [Methanobacterium alkalithermotolerans]